MPEYVVLRQIPAGPCADYFDVVYVNVDASSPEEAIRVTAIDEKRGGEGRYIAIPNTWWVAQEVTVKRIAEVNMTPVEMI